MASSSSSSSSKPNAGFVKPSEPEYTYFIELFGELHFIENPRKPVTISELFPGFPMPKPAPHPQAVIEEAITDHDQADNQITTNDAPNDVPMPVGEEVKEAARPRGLTRASLYDYPPLEKKERVFPPPITSLRQRYGGNPCPYCMKERNALSHEGGSSSSMKEGAIGDDEPKM